jgi:hypothetical protein
MISWRHVTKYMRYVPHDQAEAFCRVGWCIADAFDGTPHGAWSFLAAWLCECEPVEPRESL